MQYLIQPWKHQLDKGIIPARSRRDFAFLWDMGTGKTGAVINVLREHYAREGRLMRTLVLGPLITVQNWLDEFKAHSKIKEYDVIPLVGKGTKRVQTVMDSCTDPATQTLTRAKILVTNYESMDSAELLAILKHWQPEILVCDESHRLKNFQAKRSKAVIELLGEEPVIGANPPRYTRKLRHCYIMSGTPLLNTPMDIFQQYRILDSGETFGLNFYEFRGMFFYDDNQGMPSNVHFPKWLPRPETYEILNRRIYSKATRVMKKDCMDLPPFIRQSIPVALSTEQQRLYTEMKNEYITWIKAHENTDEPRAVVAQMAVTKALRLQQIVSGFVKTEEGQEIQIKVNPRLDVLAELLKDLTPNHKVIVWASFKQNYAQIAQVCISQKVKYVEVHGGISSAQKNANIKLFRTNPEYRVCVANQASGGIGVNLVENASIVSAGQCSYSIFYSRDFSLANDLQAQDRNYRGGSEVYESVTRIDLVAPGTIDQLGLQALAAKQDMAQSILSWTGIL